jgi:SAM-dependent methyltransferase
MDHSDPQAAALAAVKRGVRWMWSLGDYAALARLLEPCADRLAARSVSAPGLKVLDVAAGNGNYALAAAARGASVTACDVSPAMVELGRRRAEAAGREVEWLVADVEELPFEGGRFDVVASVFGAMFAPRPRRAAEELFRVARPGGVVALASYSSAGFLGSFAALMSRYSRPAPIDLPSPFEWGEEAEARRRLEGLASSLDARSEALVFEFATPEEGMAFWERANPPLAALRSMLAPDAYARLRREAAVLLRELGSRADGSLRLESRYLTVIAAKQTLPGDALLA